MDVIYGEWIALMPDTLTFQPQSLEGLNSENQEINQIFFDKTYKNVSSQVVTLYLRNNSEDKIFSGGIHIVVAEDNSYTQDMYLSENSIVWDKELFINIEPLERIEIKLKVIPVSTPESSPGKSVIAMSGGW